jgi:hypothetical protein
VPTHDGEKPHVILSLTSYPPRFPHLVQQLNQIRVQSEYPDLLILNIARDDEKKLPDEVKKLKFPFSFEINICEDLGPGTKLIPTLIRFPSSLIITIDDDIVYPENLVGTLLNESRNYPRDIIAARAHRPKFLAGIPIPYLDWDWEVEYDSSHLLMPTGCGGVLYPPLSLHSGVLDFETYEALSYSSDDYWFWVHSLRNGTRVRLINNPSPLRELHEAQLSGLSRNGNIEILNDLNLGLIWKAFDMQKTLSTFSLKNGLIPMQSTGFHPRSDDSKSNIGIGDMDEFLELLLSLEPKKRIFLMKLIVQKSIEIKNIEDNQDKLKVAIILVLRNFVRKIKSWDING